MNIRNGHYSVYPRYTPGSGAMVDASTALKAAEEERESYEQTLTGVYGEELRKRAENQGLGGIVTLSNDHTRFDLLTEEYTCRDCDATGLNKKHRTCNKCAGLGHWKIMNGERQRIR